MTRASWTRAATYGAGVLLGVVVGFFFAFNAVFADVFGFGPKAGAVAYVLGGYLVAGAVVGWPLPVGLQTRADRLGRMVALAAPGLVLIALYTVREPGRPLYHGAVLLAIALGTWAGVLLGAWARGRRDARRAVTSDAHEQGYE